MSWFGWTCTVLAFVFSIWSMVIQARITRRCRAFERLREEIRNAQSPSELAELRAKIRRLYP